jgi:hypothetical protein
VSENVLPGYSGPIWKPDHRCEAIVQQGFDAFTILAKRTGSDWKGEGIDRQSLARRQGRNELADLPARLLGIEPEPVWRRDDLRLVGDLSH